MEYIVYIFIAFIAFYFSGGLFGNLLGGLLAGAIALIIMIILGKLSSINEKLDAILKKLNEKDLEK